MARSSTQQGLVLAARVLAARVLAARVLATRVLAALVVAALVVAALALTGCQPAAPSGGPASSGGPTSSGGAASSPASPGSSSVSVDASVILAGSFEELPFRMTLPAGWSFGTTAQRDAYWASLPERGGGIAENLAEQARLTGSPIAFIAYDGTEADDRNPVVTCNALIRGSASPAEALDAGERQDLEGIRTSTNLVGDPVAERVALPVGPTVRIRWREQAEGQDLSSVGYLFVAGPHLIGCVFRAATDRIASRQAEWEAIVATIQGAALAVVKTIPVGVKPFEIVAGAGALWVPDADSGELSRIDPATNAVKAFDLRIGRSPSLAPWGVAFDGERLWVTTLDFSPGGEPEDGVLLAIDPTTGAVRDSVGIGRASIGLGVGFGSVWVSNGGDQTVVRIDPGSLKKIATIRVGAQPGALSVGADAVWVTDATDGTVARIDPRTNRVVDTVRVAEGLQAIAAGEHGVWAAARDGLYLIDPASGKVVDKLELDGIAGLFASGGTVWAAQGLGVHVWEIDEATASVVQTITLNTNSWGICELDGTVWVVHPAAAENKFAEYKPGTVDRLER